MSVRLSLLEFSIFYNMGVQASITEWSKAIVKVKLKMFY